MLKKYFHEEKGISSLELTVGMLLMIIFGAVAFMLVGSGNTAYARIMDQRDVDSDYRTATSYVLTKIRQNNGGDTVHFFVDERTEDLTIKIKELNNEVALETWIYVSNGYLKEASLLEEVVFDDAYGFEISDIDQMRLVEFNRNSVCLEFLKLEEAPVRLWITSQTGFGWEE